MKHSWIKGGRGFSLLEVLMACVILPIIIFGATSLLMGVARVSDKTNAGLDFLMTTNTVFLQLEQDLLNTTAQPPYPQFVWGPGNAYIDLQLSATFSYRYTFATQSLVNQLTGVSLSQGILLPDAHLDDYNKDGVIDGTDAGLRDTCIATPSQANCHNVGVNLVFGVASNQNRLDFSFRSARHQENGQHGFTKSIPLAK